MKKKCINWCHYSYGTRETLKKMRLLVILFFSGLLTVAASSYSQQTKFSLTLENVTVQEIFEQIEENSEFVIFYNEAYLDLEQKFDVNVKDENVEFILDKIFEKNRNNYKIYDRQIVILPPGKTNNSSVIEKNQQQERELTGKVVDGDGIPLPGASIVIKGTTVGAATNIDGNFTLTIPTDKPVTLVVQFIGFEVQEIVVGDKTTIDVVLIPGDQDLDEVVVIGYGTVMKKDLTGSVATVTEKDFNLGGSVTTPEELIQGRVAGVQVTTVSSAPGSEPIIRIRGNNSILGSNQPLYVVDGLPMNSLNNMINVEDIKSVEILKDASSTAIYGTRGANGVVIITTKRGIEGMTNIDYSFEQTYDVSANKEAYDFLNAQEYMELANYMAGIRNAPVLPYRPERMAVINKYGEGTDWMNEILRTGKIQKHNISVNAGTKKTKVFVSLHYMDQEGVVPNTNFKKITSKFNFDQKLINDKLTLSMSSLISNTTQNALGFSADNGQSNIIRNIIKGNPIIPASWDGWTEEDKQIAFADGKPINPLDMLNADEFIKTNLGIISNFNIKLDITKDLSFTTQYGVKIANIKTKHFLPDVENVVATAIQMGSAHIRHSEYLAQNFENILRFSKELDNHRITAIAVYSVNPEKWESSSAAATDFVSDNLTWNNLGAGATILAPSSAIAESNLVSYAGRVEYGFSDRYNLTATYRRDGSSKFGLNNKWGDFPSVAAAWKIHNESFFDVSFISNLKLRGGWGVTGNNGFGVGAAQPKFGAGYSVSLDSDNVRKGVAAENMGNSDLRWESTYATNIGLEVGLFDGRIILEIDAYNKRTEDLLWLKPVPASYGFSTQIDNVGASQNRGIEVLLSTVNISSKKLRWVTDITFAMNDNQIKELKLVEGADFFPGPTVGHHINSSVLMVGQPFGAFYGYKFRGILQEGQTDALQPTAVPGDPLWEDIDGDETFSADKDRTILGKGIPRYTFGISNRITYGNFELSFFFQGVADVEILNLNRIVGFESNTLASSLYDRWTPDNTDGTLPLSGWGRNYSDGRAYYTNDYNLEKGDYITLKNLRLTYRVPTKDLGLSWIKNLSVTFTGSNLLTINSYSGFYPEVNSTNGGAFDTRIAGVDSYAYPMQKSYSFGVKVGF